MNINMTTKELIEFLKAAEIVETRLKKEINETKLKKEEELFNIFTRVVQEFSNFIKPFVMNGIKLPTTLYTIPTRMKDGYQYCIRFYTPVPYQIMVCKYYCGNGVYGDGTLIASKGQIIHDCEESKKAYVSNFLHNWEVNKNFIFDKFATEIKNKYIQDLERLQKELDNLSKN